MPDWTTIALGALGIGLPAAGIAAHVSTLFKNRAETAKALAPHPVKHDDALLAALANAAEQRAGQAAAVDRVAAAVTELRDWFRDAMTRSAPLQEEHKHNMTELRAEAKAASDSARAAKHDVLNAITAQGLHIQRLVNGLAAQEQSQRDEVVAHGELRDIAKEAASNAYDAMSAAKANAMDTRQAAQNTHDALEILRRPKGARK